MVVLLSDEHRIPFDGSLDYEFRNTHNCLSLTPGVLEQLKADCNEAFSCRSIQCSDESYSSGSTYFVRNNQTPRCLLEQLALSIFRFHTRDAVFDPENSGAEWWTQVLDYRDDVGFHWDRDYGIEEDTGQNIHPHLATVTYLTDIGGPTIVLNKIGTQNTDDSLLGTADEIIVSRPMFGKHIKFDGRLLHAAPCDFLDLKTEEDEEDSDESESESEEDESESVEDEDNEEHSEEEGSKSDEITSNNNNKGKSLTKANNNSNSIDKTGKAPSSDSDEPDDGDSYPKRITFLVNIWLNHIPIQSKAFPANRVKKLQPPLSSSSSCKLFESSDSDKTVAGGSSSSEEFSSVVIPSIAIKSKLVPDKLGNRQIAARIISNKISNETEVECSDGSHQFRKWWFTHGSQKYLVSVPMPSFERLHALSIDHDAFRLLYRDSGVLIEISPVIGKKKGSICNEISSADPLVVPDDSKRPIQDNELSKKRVKKN